VRAGLGNLSRVEKLDPALLLGQLLSAPGEPAAKKPGQTTSSTTVFISFLGEPGCPVAPLWVRWIAQDSDGAWWGYEAEPHQGPVGWYENEVGRLQRLGQGTPNPQWRDALFPYP